MTELHTVGNTGDKLKDTSAEAQACQSTLCLANIADSNRDSGSQKGAGTDHKDAAAAARKQAEQDANIDKLLGFVALVKDAFDHQGKETPPEAKVDTAARQKALFNQFSPALELYHTGGRKNGGGIDGIQLPPKVSEAQLQPFIKKLSTFISKEDGLDEKEPAKGQPDKEFRLQLEKEAAPSVQLHRQLYVETALSLIQNPVIKDMVKDAVQQAPPEFLTAPSSSSGKFHPADEVNVGGLALHSLRDEIMGAKLIDFYNQDASVNVVGNQKLVGDQRDLILGALLLHDIEKGGVPWHKYDAAHGPLGATFLEGVWKDSEHQDYATKMEELVNNHMAQWNKSTDQRPDPKPPKDIANQIVSYADYLGAQPNVFVQPFPGRDN